MDYKIYARKLEEALARAYYHGAIDAGATRIMESAQGIHCDNLIKAAKRDAVRESR